MIVGSGNIAKCLTDRPGAIFFASGVSNSRCEDWREFRKEEGLLILLHAKDPNDCIFYFSSLSAQINVDDRSNQVPYFAHKLKMEHIIKGICDNYVILRIGNLIGDTNPNTFINYIKTRQAQGLSVEIRDEVKYMIDGATLNMLCQTLPLNQKIELTVATKIGKVRDFL